MYIYFIKKNKHLKIAYDGPLEVSRAFYLFNYLF